MELSSKTSCGLCLESLVGKAKGHRVDENLERFIAEVFPSNVFQSGTSTNLLCSPCLVSLTDFTIFRTKIIAKHGSFQENFVICEVVKAEPLTSGTIINYEPSVVKQELPANFDSTSDLAKFDNDSESDDWPETKNEEESDSKMMTNTSEAAFETTLKQIKEDLSNRFNDSDSDDIPFAKKFNIPSSTLKSRKSVKKPKIREKPAIRKKKFISKTPRVRLAYLSPETEIEFASFLVDNNKKGILMTRDEVREEALRIYKLNLKPGEASKRKFTENWLKNFLHRYPEVKVKSTREILALKPQCDKEDENEQYGTAKIPSYSQADLTEALLQIEEGATVVATAKKFNIPERSLHNRRPKRIKRSRQFLSNKTEDELASLIVKSTEMGHPKTKEGICKEAARLYKLQLKPGESPTRQFTVSWIKSFLLRHPEVQFKPQRKNSKIKADIRVENPDDAAHFITCNYCGKTMRKYTHYYHFTKFHKHDAKIFECDECDFKTPLKSVLKTHLMRVHYKSKVKCEDCGKLLSSVTTLKEHVESKHGKTYKPQTTVCDQCGQVFETVLSYRRHKLTHKERKYKCEYPMCTRSFSWRSVRDNHVKIDHLKVKDFICQHPGCGMEFGYKQKLQKHQKDKQHSDSFVTF